MRSFAVVGAILSGHGQVTGKRQGDGGGEVDVDVWTASSGTKTASGTATVWLPSRGFQR